MLDYYQGNKCNNVIAWLMKCKVRVHRVKPGKPWGFSVRIPVHKLSCWFRPTRVSTSMTLLGRNTWTGRRKPFVWTWATLFQSQRPGCRWLWGISGISNTWCIYTYIYILIYYIGIFAIVFKHVFEITIYWQFGKGLLTLPSGCPHSCYEGLECVVLDVEHFFKTCLSVNYSKVIGSCPIIRRFCKQFFDNASGTHVMLFLWSCLIRFCVSFNSISVFKDRACCNVLYLGNL